MNGHHTSARYVGQGAIAAQRAKIAATFKAIDFKPKL
jgi:hypothetical protein